MTKLQSPSAERWDYFYEPAAGTEDEYVGEDFKCGKTFREGELD
jgi:hypothetical protein